ncbi:rRNA processing/ribosome biogenesis-domain-containing protein [Chytriomyces sp. MP71]|nr:rRNA processing/ribosome biogenesis-domain-containing protein [Chytriomyces sp. MP71]
MSLASILGNEPVPTAATLRLVASTVQSDPESLARMSKSDGHQVVVKVSALLNNKTCKSSNFYGAVLVRLCTAHCSDILFGDHASHWANVLLSLAKKSTGPLLDEILLSLRAVIVRARSQAHLHRDVSTPNIQKLFTWFFQKVESSEHAIQIVCHTLQEFVVLASFFPSTTKPFTDKVEALSVETLNKANLTSKMQAQAVKALVVANRIIANKGKSTGDKSEAFAVSTSSGRLTESLLAIVQDLVTVGSKGANVPHVSKTQPYLKKMEGSYSANIAILLDRFKAFVQCHLYLLGTKAEKPDGINPKLVITIAGLIVENCEVDKSRNGHHDAIYAEKLAFIMPVLVNWINRLLVTLIGSLRAELVPDRDVLWAIIRQSFAFSSNAVPVRITIYRLLTAFIEAFGVNGVDSVYQGILEDCVEDLSNAETRITSRTGASLIISAAKCLSAIITYTTPTHLSSSALNSIFATSVKSLLFSTVNSQSPGPFSNSVQRALAILLVKSLQPHSRDAVPYDWVACGMKTLFTVISGADAELRSSLEEHVSFHTDVLFGYRPVFEKRFIENAEVEEGVGMGWTGGSGHGAGSRKGWSAGGSGSSAFMDVIEAVAKAPIVAPVVQANVAVEGATQAEASDSVALRAVEIRLPPTAPFPAIAEPAPIQFPKLASIKPPSVPVTDDMEVEVEETRQQVKRNLILPDDTEQDGDIDLPDINIDDFEEEGEEEEGGEEDNEDE